MALTIPPPADAPDEPEYLRTRSARASLAVEAIDRVLRDRSADDLDLVTAADVLRRQLADHEPTGYEHSGLGS
jgi:hypothetical protein